MSISPKSLEGSTSFLASKQLAIALFLLLVLSLIPGTFVDTDHYRMSMLSRAIAGCMGLNLVLCTVRRLRTLPRPVLIMHAGTFLTIAGAMISSLGFVATVNIYEGSSIDTVYRWDLEQDAPLGVTLTVRKIGIEYYPIPVKIGVLKGKDKAGLYELKTGSSFELNGFTVKADSLDLPSEDLWFSVFQGGRLIGSLDTDGSQKMSPEFPYELKLVAYQKPTYKRVVVDLALTQGAEVKAEGSTEINDPFEWNGLRFHHTAVEWDEYGNLYAGIQIVKDPGRPVVYVGFVVIIIGSLLWAVRKFRGNA